MTKIKQIVALACLLSVTMPAQAWNGTGHMVVAYIAYKKLNKPTRNRVDVLLKLNPMYSQWTSGVANSQKGMVAFLNAAVWPDCIKGTCPGYKSDGADGGNTPPPGPAASQNIGYADMAMHKYWHYVDKPYPSPAGFPAENPHIPNAETQFPILMSGISGSASDDIKSYDIAWLEHLTGDVHQPLHATARFTAAHPHGDIGGNSVKFCPTPCRDNLHSYWDELLGTTTNPKAIGKLGDKLLKKPKPSGANEMSISVWTNASFDLAKKTVYAAPVSLDDDRAVLLSPRPDAAYAAKAKALADAQVLLAGYRLAGILNANLH
jgi:hypothetical protein